MRNAKSRVRAHRLHVMFAEALEARQLLTTYTVTSVADVINANDGVITLREAITASNTNAASGNAPAGSGGTATDFIRFNIPGTGVQTINLTSALNITGKVDIDGYSQPGASRNTLETGGNAQLRILVRPTTTADTITLAPGSNNSKIAGLVIHSSNLGGQAVVVNSNGNTIVGNYVNMTPSGTGGAGSYGLTVNGTGNFIGTASPGDRNVINSQGAGINLFGASNTVHNNYVGTNAAGTASATSASIGINVAAGNQIIGGSVLGQGNVISGWGGPGISLKVANGTVVQGNFIGTTAFGNEAIPNIFGIVVSSSTGVTIGGTQLGAGNVIANAGGRASVILNRGSQGNDADALNIAILGNTIFGDSAVPIDLSTTSNGDGATANDNLDADSGPNRLQNKPVITAAVAIDDEVKNRFETRVLGTLNSTASTSIRVEFFSESFGTTAYLGSQNVTTDGSGSASFDAALPYTESGRVIRATATRIASGVPVETSELSTGVAVVDAPRIRVNDVVVSEDADFARFTLSMTGNNTTGVALNGNTLNGSAIDFGNEADYSGISGRFVRWAPGDTSDSPLFVPLVRDGRVEEDETFFLFLDSAPYAVIEDEFGFATILNDDVTDISVANTSVTEGNSGSKTVNVTFTRNGVTSGISTVNYTTQNGTATAGSDYNSQFSSVSFAPGQTSRTVAFTVLGDTAVESNETFNVVLSSPTGTKIGVGTATVTITNDDVAPPALSVSDVSTTEGNSGSKTVNVTVTRSGNTAGSSTVRYFTVEGGATPGSDYAETSGTLTFAAGQTSKTVPVTIFGDTLVEGDEALFFQLENPTGATISNNFAFVTILNDDTATLPTLSINDVGTTEGNSGTKTLTFTITRSGPTTGTSTVKYNTGGNTATSGDNDYTGTNGTVTFSAGQTSKTIAITIKGDIKVEPNETFFVNLSAPTGATIADAQGVATLLNDDNPPTGGSVVIQAETGTRSSGAAVSTGQSGFTGTGYVNLGSSGNFVQLPFNAAAAGSHSVVIRYANGSTTNRPINILVNGNVITTNTLAPTGSWTTWKDVTVNLNFVAGANTLRLTSTGSTGANVDRVTISPNTTPPPSSVTIQAETGTRSSGAAVGTGQSGFTGTGYVNLGTNGNFVQVTTNRATAGATTLKVRFANGSTINRPMSVSVNGTVQQANVALSGNGSWTSWREVTFTLNLVAGSNAIRLTSIGSAGANIDSITVG